MIARLALKCHACCMFNRLDWIGLDWIGLDWIGLDWINWMNWMDWICSDWIKLDWINLINWMDLDGLDILYSIMA